VLVEELPVQRRVSRERRTYLLPLGLLIFFTVDLIWEIVKGNLDAPARTAWPWRFTVLDETTCAAVVAVLAGILATRTQISQTMKPVLGWSSTLVPSLYIPDSRRTVHLHNGGGGRAVVRSVTYQLAASKQPNPEQRWLTWSEAVDFLLSAGLEPWRDVMLLALGTGSALPMTSKPVEGFELAAFSEDALEALAQCDIRIQVVDVLGDTYERTICCMGRWPITPPPVQHEPHRRAASSPHRQRYHALRRSSAPRAGSAIARTRRRASSTAAQYSNRADQE